MNSKDNFRGTQLAPNLVSRLKNDELEAFNEIYNLYFRKLIKFAYGFSITMEDAEEVVHDSFIKLWDKRKLLEEKKSLDAFLFVIARNVIIDKIRKYNLDKSHLEHYFNAQLIQPKNRLEEQIHYEELDELISGIIAELPPKRKLIFELNRYKGMTYKEIAHHLNINVGTVEKQMSKALHKLKEKLSYLGVSF